MTHRTGDTDGRGQDEIYRRLAHHRRRRLLSILDERARTVTVADLATRVAAAESDTRPEDVDQEEVDAIQIDLRHVHLPVLLEAGWIEWDRAEEVVRKTSHPELRTSTVRTHVAMLDPTWDRVVSALTNRRRRAILSLASDRQTPIERDELVDALVTRERAHSDGDVSVADLRTALHHQHLPALTQAGLLEYDHEDATVTRVERPLVDSECLEAVTTEPPQPLLESVRP